MHFFILQTSKIRKITFYHNLTENQLILLICSTNKQPPWRSHLHYCVVPFPALCCFMWSKQNDSRQICIKLQIPTKQLSLVKKVVIIPNLERKSSSDFHTNRKNVYLTLSQSTVRPIGIVTTFLWKFSLFFFFVNTM